MVGLNIIKMAEAAKLKTRPRFLGGVGAGGFNPLGYPIRVLLIRTGWGQQGGVRLDY